MKIRVGRVTETLLLTVRFVQVRLCEKKILKEEVVASLKYDAESCRIVASEGRSLDIVVEKHNSVHFAHTGSNTEKFTARPRHAQ